MPGPNYGSVRTKRGRRQRLTGSTYRRPGASGRTPAALNARQGLPKETVYYLPFDVNPGSGLRAAGMAASRLGAMTPAPQSRLALMGGGTILNAIGTLIGGKPVGTNPANRRRVRRGNAVGKASPKKATRKRSNVGKRRMTAGRIKGI